MEMRYVRRLVLFLYQIRPERCQYNLWRQRDFRDGRAKRPQRIIDRIRHRRGRPGRAGLARALGAQFRLRRRRHHMADIDIGHFAGHRDQIIGHIGVGELAALVIDAFFEQRRAEPLHHPAPDLLVDQLRIDDGAAILDHPVLQQFDEAGVGIDLQPRGLNAVGEGERIFAGHKMPRRHQFGLDARRQRVGPEIDDPRQFVQFDARRAVARR